MDSIDAPYDDFTVYSKSKEAWYHSAWHLMGAAGALWACKNEQRSTELVSELGIQPEFSMVHALRNPYLMLCGMSLELLFKAIVVAKNQKPLPRHNLLQLAVDAAVPLTDKQKGSLELLSQYVIWAGRYPVPNDKKYYEPFFQLDHMHRLVFEEEDKKTGTVYPTRKLRPNTQLDWEPFHQLWKRAEEIYRQHER